jgi:hypothetical protein
MDGTRRTPRPTLRCLGLPGLLGLLGLLVSCATPTVMEPRLRGLQDVAVVSVYGSRDLGLLEMGPGPLALGDSVGEEAAELVVGDALTFLEGIYGAGHVVAPKQAMASKKYDALPEAQPTDQWSQVDRMIAVDLDHGRTPEALAALARSLDVDAVVVIRHEWWLARERYELVRALSLYDRCTILVVDRDGVVLWRDVAMGRSAARTMWSSQLQFGLSGDAVVAESRSLARETARQAHAELQARALALPPLPPSASVRTRAPPPPLETPPSLETPPTPSPSEASPSPRPE